MVWDGVALNRECKLRGAVARLFTTYDPEILIDGPAGTGKTYGVIRYCDWLARTYPGCRILWVRETLESQRESTQQIFEDFILWPGHYALRHTGDRKSRSHYDYDNGSRIVLAGLDTPERLMSTEYDVIVAFEATNPHVTERAWSLLASRNRGMNIPHPECDYPDGLLEDGVTTTRQAMVDERFPGGVDKKGRPLFLRRMIADCNPDSESHWLWRRFEAGHMTRLRSIHADNPLVTNDYLDKLKSQPGVLYDRLYLGKWVTAEGAIWGTFVPKRHEVRVDFEMDPLVGRRFVSVPDWVDDKGEIARYDVGGVIAGLDWGFTSPGSIQVAAVTPDRRAFQLAEVYATDKGLEWWAERVVELVDEFKIEVVRCDPSRPECIELLNQRLGHRAGREVGGIAQPAVNKLTKRGSGDMGGLDIVREAFRQNRAFLNRGGLRHRDERLDAEHLPTCLREEIPVYVFENDAKTGLRLETPAKNSIDHACDAWRYLLMDVWAKSWKTAADVRFVPPEGVIAYHVGSPEERMRLRQLHERNQRRQTLTW